MDDNMLEESKCKCGNLFWNYTGKYFDCIWCWYDRIYKRTLAGKSRVRDRA